MTSIEEIVQQSLCGKTLRLAIVQHATIEPRIVEGICTAVKVDAGVDDGEWICVEVNGEWCSLSLERGFEILHSNAISA